MQPLADVGFSFSFLFKKIMLSASMLPVQNFKGDLRHKQQKVRKEADALSPQEMNKTEVNHHHWHRK
eukprot:1156228-Pelagomonas_calceolata.AAC.1